MTQGCVCKGAILMPRWAVRGLLHQPKVVANVLQGTAVLMQQCQPTGAGEAAGKPRQLSSASVGTSLGREGREKVERQRFLLLSPGPWGCFPWKWRKRSWEMSVGHQTAPHG